MLAIHEAPRYATVECILSSGTLWIVRWPSKICGNLSFGAARWAGRFGGIAHLFTVALHFAQGIDGLVLGFVIGAGDYFAEKTHRNELDATDNKGHGEQ